MTVKEALIVEIGLEVTDGMVQKAMLDFNLDGNDEYTEFISIDISRAAISILLNASYVKSISQGGYSISFDTDAINRRLLYLAKKTGNSSLINDLLGKPTIKRVRKW